jgi:hypothetical protein
VRVRLQYTEDFVVTYSVYRQAFTWDGLPCAPRLVKTFRMRCEAESLIRRLSNATGKNDYYYVYSLREEAAVAATAGR